MNLPYNVKKKKIDFYTKNISTVAAFDLFKFNSPGIFFSRDIQIQSQFQKKKKKYYFNLK